MTGEISRAAWQRGGPPIAAGATAEVFACGDGVLKPYRAPDGRAEALREAAIRPAIAARGLPVPRPRGIRRRGGRRGPTGAPAPGGDAWRVAPVCRGGKDVRERGGGAPPCSASARTVPMAEDARRA